MITRVATVSPLFSSLWGSGHWSKMLSMSARDTTPIAPLMGEDQNSIIQVKTETRKEKGDSVIGTSCRRRLLRGSDCCWQLRSNATLCSERCDQRDWHVCSPPSQNSIDHKRIPFNLRDEAERRQLMPNAGLALVALPAADRDEAAKKPKRALRASKYITMRQATNIMEAVRFAKIDRPSAGGASHHSLEPHRCRRRC